MSVPWEVLWAKTSEHNAYHPLLCHLTDVAEVAHLIWKECLHPACQAILSDALEVKPDVCGRWLAYWAGLHDLGKATPGFQWKWPLAVARLQQAGFSGPRGGDFPHGLLSARILPKILQQQGLSEEISLQVADAVGGHHGRFVDSSSVRRSALGRGTWNSAREEIAQALLELFDLSAAPRPRGSGSSAIWLLVAGLVSVADWLGSDADHFPYLGTSGQWPAYVELSRQRARQALESHGWLGWKPAESPQSLHELFPFIPSDGARPLQQAAADLCEQLNQPGLVILEAPMGEGKTEAAMLLADHWSAKLGQRGCYFALPTQATSNQMFGRVRDFLADRYPGQQVNFHLLHGHASLSAEFAILRQQGRVTELSGIYDEEASGFQGGVLANRWFTFRKRGLLAPFGVGTVDQALLAALRGKHGFVRLFGLAHKTVIIDEVHAYDAYMSHLLERLLAWLAALGSSVVLLSATLPAKTRQRLLAAYAGQPPALDNSEPYPRLSWAFQGKVGSRSFSARSQTVQLVSAPYDPASLANWLIDKLDEGGCLAVICNTVGRAQEVYQAVQACFDGWLRLFHSRFPFAWRAEIEAETLAAFGKPSPSCHRPPRAILIATQVIEQSLDVDFDLMVSDLAPIDLLLQRAGRLHRHERSRPQSLATRSLGWAAPFQADELPDFVKVGIVYQPHVLLRSWLSIRNRKQIAMPSEVESLIESVYDDRPPDAELPATWQVLWQETAAELAKETSQAAAEARSRMLLPPGTDDTLWQLYAEALEEDAPELHQAFQALTRLTRPSVSLICLRQDPAGEPRTVDASARLVDFTTTPKDRHQLESLLGSSVSVSMAGVVRQLKEHPRTPNAWKSSAWLADAHPIIFDQSGQASLGPYQLTLSRDVGLVVERLDSQQEEE